MVTAQPKPDALLLEDLALARSGLDRAAERRTDEAWLSEVWGDPHSRVLRVHDGRTLVAGEPPRLVFASAAEIADAAGDRFMLGVGDDGTTYLALHDFNPLEPADGQVSVGLREVGAALDDLESGLLVHAIALANWHSTHQFCPRCGAPTRVVAGGHIRVCEADGSQHFPRTDPAVIVLVTDASGERAVLGRQQSWPEGRYSTLAGFVEPGESAEHAVKREVKEEVGLDVDAVRFLGSQPWPFPSSLMLGFTARVVGDDQIHVDGEEIVEALWVTRDDVRDQAAAGAAIVLPPRVSIARRLVEHWYGGELPGEGLWRSPNR